MRLTRTLTTLALAAVAALSLAACGGSDSSQVANLGDTTTTSEEGSDDQAPEDAEEAILAYTECMRGEGIDLPDPDFSGEPGEGGFLGGSGIDPNDPDFQDAQEKCQSNLEGIQGQFDPEDLQAFQDAALEFAQCLRDHGFDVPDPDFSQGGPGQGGVPGGGGGGIFGDSGIDPEDPEVQAALEDCQEAFGDLPGPGGPGGPPGAQDGES